MEEKIEFIEDYIYRGKYDETVHKVVNFYIKNLTGSISPSKILTYKVKMSNIIFTNVREKALI